MDKPCHVLHISYNMNVFFKYKKLSFVGLDVELVCCFIFKIYIGSNSNFTAFILIVQKLVTDSHKSLN